MYAQLRAKMTIDTSKTLRPGSAGLEGMRALNAVIRDSPLLLKPTVVIDNAHRAEPQTLKDFIAAAPDFGWVLLAQPSSRNPLFEALLDVHATALAGWSIDTIIEECYDVGMRIDLETAQRVLRLTGGMPLFVRNLASIAVRTHSGDVARFCDEIESATNLEELAQQSILAQVVNQLSDAARLGAMLMLLCPLPLAATECQTFLSSVLGLPAPKTADILRELRKWGVTQHRFDGAVAIHDSFRAVRFASETEVSPDLLRQARESLAELLKESFGPGHVDRLVLYCRLLADLGNGHEIAGIVSGVAEHLYDLGRAKELIGLLSEIMGDERVALVDRFLAADTATFWSICREDGPSTEVFLDFMERSLRAGVSDAESLCRFAHKKMVLAARQQDHVSVEGAFNTAESYAKTDAVVYRVLRYTYALAQFELGRYHRASELAKNLTEEYGTALGISVAKHLRGTNLPEIRDALGRHWCDTDEIKRFADSLDLRARSLQKLSEPSTNLFLYAHKLYVLANAPTSAVKAGMDFVFSLVESSAVQEARTFMENTLIPLVEAHRLLEQVIPVQSEYAVILAYCGQGAKAKSLLARLSKVSMDQPDTRNEFEHRVELVDKIERERIRPRAMLGPGGNPLVAERGPLGRNSLCQCGSGLKFKKCCGSP